MGRSSGAKRDETRRQKIAAQRAAARRAQVRQRIWLAAGSVVAVAAVAVTVVLVGVGSGSATVTGDGAVPAGAALSSLVTEVTGVSNGTLNQVGTGNLNASDSGLTSVSGSALTKDGKPEILYVGAEYCPYCAAERWAMVIALSRFGAFSGLGATHSSSTDAYPDTATFTFYGSTYTSKYLSFVPVEETTNQPDGSGGYTALQTPTPAEQALLEKYDTSTSIPFIDIGNRYVQVGDLNGYNPQDLQGKTWSQIAAALRDPSSTIAKDIDASANYLTAVILKLAGGQPAPAATPAVKAIEARL